VIFLGSSWLIGWLVLIDAALLPVGLDRQRHKQRYSTSGMRVLVEPRARLLGGTATPSGTLRPPTCHFCSPPSEEAQAPQRSRLHPPPPPPIPTILVLVAQHGQPRPLLTNCQFPGYCRGPLAPAQRPATHASPMGERGAGLNQALGLAASAPHSSCVRPPRRCRRACTPLYRALRLRDAGPQSPPAPHWHSGLLAQSTGRPQSTCPGPDLLSGVGYSSCGMPGSGQARTCVD